MPKSPVIVDPTHVCQLLVGLSDVAVLGARRRPSKPIVCVSRPRRVAVVQGSAVARCRQKDKRPRELVDLLAFRRPTRLMWRSIDGLVQLSRVRLGRSPRLLEVIATARIAMTDRAGRWVTEQVGRCETQRERDRRRARLRTGTRSTTPSSPTAHRWSRTLPASATSTPWGWTRRCSPGSGAGGASTGRHRSLMCAAGSSST